MNYEEALQYLSSLVDYERRDGYSYTQSFKLERMRRLASLLGDPQKYFKSIHIAGSKGKGSTSSFVFSILKAAGYRTGLYTSPHLTIFRERIRIGDDLISEEDSSRLLRRIRSVTDKMGDDRPTFFEVYTALAFLYFMERGVDFAVFEVGLGGRLDATNILEPLVSGITPISYEHTDRLGNTLSEIAVEKAGIVKDRGICVVAPQEKEALNTILKACCEKNTRVIIVGEDIKFSEIDSSDSKEIFSVFGALNEYIRLEMSLLGSHQVANAATAIGMIEALSLRGINIQRSAIESGIRDTRWPGRIEVVSRSPYVVLDGAQNRASARALALAIKRAFRYKKLVMTLGISKDKDIKGVLEELIPISDEVILTRSKVAERAADPARMKELVTPRIPGMHLTDNVEEAVHRAGSLSGPDDLILVTGSLFVVGEARQIFCG